MVRIDRIVTRGGDDGETSLGDGARVRKDALRVEAYGTVDEANALIGLLRLQTADTVDAMLARIQNDLFDIGADLCVPHSPATRERLRLGEAPVLRLEAEVEAMNAPVAALTSFILPGGSAGAAAAHHARTVVRRAERLVVRLAAEEVVTPAVLRYLNRLSDHLFVMARVLNRNGAADVLWVPGANR